jgi:hypothetical protein
MEQQFVTPCVYSEMDHELLRAIPAHITTSRQTMLVVPSTDNASGIKVHSFPVSQQPHSVDNY